MRNDEKLAEAAQRICAMARRMNVTMQMPTARQAELRLTEVLRALNENTKDRYVLARAHGRKFPGDRGYRWYHLKRWVRGGGEVAVVMDNPRDILKAAGVECAEVDQYAARPRLVRHPHGELTIDKDQADAAILTLSRLVAKYKWIAERHESVVDRVIMDRRPQFDALEARWEAEHDA